MRSLILTLLVLQLLLPGAFSLEARKPKPVMCKNPKAKEGSSVLQGCSKATCSRVGKKGVWQQCPALALEKTVIENQRKIDRNHEVLKEILEILGQPSCCPTIQTTTWQVPASTSLEGCASTWTKFGSHCYKFFAAEKIAWNEASTNCTRAGGFLASIHSAEENQFLVNLSPQNSRVLIGGNDLDTEGTFVWTDGSAWDYQNWSPSQPDNHSWNGASGIEHCLELGYANETLWNDLPCNLNVRVTGGFICKKK